MVVTDCNPREMGEGGSDVRVYSQLHGELETSPGCMRLCLKAQEVTYSLNKKGLCGWIKTWQTRCHRSKCWWDWRELAGVWCSLETLSFSAHFFSWWNSWVWGSFCRSKSFRLWAAQHLNIWNPDVLTWSPLWDLQECTQIRVINPSSCDTIRGWTHFLELATNHRLLWFWDSILEL